MKTKVKTIAIGLGLIGTTIFTASAIWPSNTNFEINKVIDGAQMKFEATEISIGEVPQGKPIDISFELTNQGTAALVIGQAKPSCGCTNVQYPQHPINPGDKAEITAVYSSRKAGPFTKTITVFSNAS